MTKRVLTGFRVLIVEDEYFLADDLARTLEDAGAAVLGPVSTAGEALSLLGTSEVHLAVLDINLGDHDVYPVASELRQRSVPFLFATGYGGSSVSADFLDVPRWEKPFSVERLTQALPGLRPAPQGSPEGGADFH